MTLYGCLVLASVYLGVSAAHTFGLIGWEAVGVTALIASFLFAAAEVGR